MFKLQYVACATKQLYLLVADLLTSGADPTKRDADGLSAIFMALHYRFSFPLVDLLLQKGSDVEQEWIFDGYEISVMDVALKMGERDTVSLLLRSNALPSYSGKKLCGVKLVSFASS